MPARPLRSFLARPTTMSLGVCLALFILWMLIGQHFLWTGPAEWDDVMYVEFAAVPQPRWEIRNRYVHIWSLRLFLSLLEPRPFAAGVYANAVLAGSSVMAFVLGRRMGGWTAGILAGLLVPLYPALLLYITIPYVDSTMVFWSAVAILAAAGAKGEGWTSKVALLGSGIACYLALKSKETGLTVLPAVWLLVVTSNPQWGRALFVWAGGVLLGWAGLATIELLMLGPEWDKPWTPANLSIYFQKQHGGPGKPSRYLFRTDFVRQLFEQSLLPFTLIGISGAAAALRRRERLGQALALWALAALWFSALTSWHYPGIDAEIRYCTVIGFPLTVLGCHWVVSTVREGNREPERTRFLLILVAVLIVVAFPVKALHDRLLGDFGTRDAGSLHYLWPAVATTLWAVPWVTQSKRLRVLALSCFVAITAMVSLHEAHRYVTQVNLRMKPWREVVAWSDACNVNIVRWKGKRPYTRWRVWRRFRSLSDRGRELVVRDIQTLDELGDDEWLFTSKLIRRDLQNQGWVRIAHGREKSGAPWSIYVPPDYEPPPGCPHP